MMRLRNHGEGRKSLEVLKGTPINGVVGYVPFLLGLFMIVEVLLAGLIFQPFSLVFSAVRGVNPLETWRCSNRVRRALEYLLLATELRIIKEVRGGWSHVKEEEINTAQKFAVRLSRKWWFVPGTIYASAHILTGVTNLEAMREYLKLSIVMASKGYRWEPPTSVKELMRDADAVPLNQGFLGSLRGT